MLNSLAILLVCQLFGEVIAQTLGLPLPGPVIGMMILFIGLLARHGVPEPLLETTRSLLDNLSLLFIPAGVGILMHLSLVAEEWLAISIGLVGSTLLTVAVTALVVVGLQRVQRGDDDAEEDVS